MLPLKVKFNLNSFVISHKDGSRDTFDGSLSDAYSSLEDGDSVAYSNLGDNYKRQNYMSWVPVIIDAENMHDARPIIRKLSKEHALAVGRATSKQIVLVFPIDRNVPVQGSDQLDYKTVYQALLSYFTGVVKTTAKDSGIDLKVHRMPFLKTPKSEPYAFLQKVMRSAAYYAELKHDVKSYKHNATLYENKGKHDQAKTYKDKADQAAKQIKHISDHLLEIPYQPIFKYAQMLVGNGNDAHMQYILNALQYSYVAKHLYDHESFPNNDQTEEREWSKEETYNQISTIIYKAYLDLDKSDEERGKHFNSLLRKAVALIHPYDGSWNVDFADVIPEPDSEYGLKKDWKLNFHDGKPWITPTDSLMKMIRADISDIKKPNIHLITTGEGKHKHTKAGMTSNYQLELVDPRICGHSLAYNKVSKQVEFLHAIDTQYVHARYEERDEDGTVTGTDRNRAFPLNDDIIAQIKTGLEQVEGNVVNKSSMLEAISSVARQNAYDPVSSYIDSLPAWDGKERLATMLIRFLGVPDTPIMRHESEIFGIASVFLGLNPGGKFDQMFDLIGTQGVGKTTFLMKYFNSFGKKGLDPTWPRDNFNWYLQGIRSFDQKDDSLAMAGMLCVNDDEMTASKHAGVETLKQIASAPFLKVRKPYDILPTKIERTFIMCRTSNLTQNQYKASHGQRKFVPFLVSKDRHTLDCTGPNSVMTPAFVDQCWSEAYYKYRQLKADGKLVSFFSLSEDEEDQLKEARVSLQYIDDLKINAIGFVNYRLKVQGGKLPLSFKTGEIIKYVTGDDRENITLSRKLQPILTNDLGFKHTLVGRGRSRRSGYVSTDETKKDLDQLNNDLKKM